MTTAQHVRAWLEEIDYRKLTKKQIRELMKRKEAGEDVPDVPQEFKDLLISKSEKRLKRISEEIDQQYKSKKLVSD
jgi:hypothetical protein